MRIKIMNTPRIRGLVWMEVVVGISMLVGVGIPLIPF